MVWVTRSLDVRIGFNNIEYKLSWVRFPDIDTNISYMTKEEYYKENNMITIRSHWISLDVCPQCKSKKTFHSEWMDDVELQKESDTNTFRLISAKPRVGDDVVSSSEITFSKEDLCLECGHTWVMYVEVIKVLSDKS